MSKDYTLDELCESLGVTPDWVNLAGKELDLKLAEDPESNLKCFTSDHYYILRNIKITELCAVGRQEIREIYKKELIAREEIARYLKNLTIAKDAGKIHLKEDSVFIYFIFARSIEIPFNISINYEKESFKPPATISHDLDYIFSNGGFYAQKEKIDQRAHAVKEELVGFMGMTYYRPIKVD